jgi:hypothetical protein
VHPLPGLDDVLAAIAGYYVHERKSAVKKKTSSRLPMPHLSAVVNEFILLLSWPTLLLFVKGLMPIIKIMQNNIRT